MTNYEELLELLNKLRADKLDIELRIGAVQTTLNMMKPTPKRASVPASGRATRKAPRPSKKSASVSQANRQRKVDRKFRESTLAFVKQKGRVSIGEVARAFGITDGAAWWRLEQLTEEGKLKHYGNDLNGKSSYVEVDHA